MESCLVASRPSVLGSQRNFTPWLTAPQCFVRRSGYCHTSAPQPPGLRQGRSPSTTTRRAIVRDWNWYWKVWRVPSSMAKRWGVITCPLDMSKRGDVITCAIRHGEQVRHHYIMYHESWRTGERSLYVLSYMAKKWDAIKCTMRHGEQVIRRYMYHQTWRTGETSLLLL